MTVKIECPNGSYDQKMKIKCSKAGYCGNQYFKRCKGWWALTENAKRCPLREEENGTEIFGTERHPDEKR